MFCFELNGNTNTYFVESASLLDKSSKPKHVDENSMPSFEEKGLLVYSFVFDCPCVCRSIHSTP